MRSFILAAAAIGVALLAVACGGTSEAAGDGSKLTLVAYSTPREVYAQLTKDFKKTDAGKGVGFDASYGSSGEQSRAVESGLPADVVAFSLAPDVERLVEAGLVNAGWADDEYGGMVTSSVVVFAVRKNNPERIETWDDLVREGIEVIEPHLDVASLALVGHEPYLSELASILLTGSRTSLTMEIKKGGVARLWLNDGLRRGTASLRWLVTPKVLRALSG